MTDVICPLCQANVPEVNLMIHQVVCERNGRLNRRVVENVEDVKVELQEETKICPVCLEHVEVSEFNQHLCTCEYCELRGEFEMINEHRVDCGNRTEFCNRCNENILRRQFQLHRQMNQCRRPDIPKRSLEELRREVRKYVRE